jgi:hypothetical protein
MKPSPKKALLLTLGLALPVVGLACPARDLGPVVPVVQSGTKIIITQPESDAVDLLVMVDNSSSMAQEQANLTENFQILLDTLTSPPADKPGGRPLVGDLHVGVISSDMGTGGFAVQSCLDSIDGDDGVLRNLPSASPALDCEESYPTFLSFDAEAGDDPAAMNAAFSCLATLGTEGCGFEQQLEAVRKALTTHADGANAGFLRDGSLLAVLLVTDEEDCSIRPDGSDIFSGGGGLGLRCYTHREQYVQPVSSYVDDILALRADKPERLVVAAIVGIPQNTLHGCNLTDMTEADFQCLLNLPAMQETIDQSAEGKGERLTPSCSAGPRGEAFPPRRIVDFVRQVSATTNSGIIRSICEDDFQPAMEAITKLISTRVEQACVARPLVANGDGQVACIVQEQLATTEPCGPGRIDKGVLNGKRLCQICQQGDGVTRMEDELGTRLDDCGPTNGTGDFWRYDPTPAEGCPDGRVAFEGATVPGEGSTAYLECLSAI